MRGLGLGPLRVCRAGKRRYRYCLRDFHPDIEEPWLSLTPQWCLLPGSVSYESLPSLKHCLIVMFHDFPHRSEWSRKLGSDIRPEWDSLAFLVSSINCLCTKIIDWIAICAVVISSCFRGFGVLAVDNGYFTSWRVIGEQVDRVTARLGSVWFEKQLESCGRSCRCACTSKGCPLHAS